MTAGLDIDLDEALGLRIDQAAGFEPELAAPTTTALAERTDALLAQGEDAFRRAPGSAVEPFVCRDMLSPQAQAKALEYAKQFFPRLLEDPNALGEFGLEAVEGINAMGARMLQEAGRSANIPELTQITRDLDSRMRGFTRKYAAGDLQATSSQYDKLKGQALEFFNKFRDLLHMLLQDAKGIEAYLDSLAAMLEDKRGELRHNVALCNELYSENEIAIGKLVGVIAVMENIRDEAETSVRAMVVDEAASDAREQRERRDLVVEFIQAMDVRISEFKQRLFVAWATSPQIRNIRAISYGLGQRLALLINLTIPVFRLTVVQWVALEIAARAADTQAAVADANNTALQAWSQAAGRLVPQVARQIQTPSTSPATILAVAESLAAQARGIEEAYRFGIAARSGVEQAIVAAAASMADTSDRHAATVLDLVAAARKPLDLSSRVELPDVVRDNAAEVLAPR